MLNYKKQNVSNRITIALLLFISCITIQTPGSAEDKISTAEEYRDRGFVAQKKGNLPEALNYYIKAIELGLESPVVLNDIGIIYEHIDMFSKAELFYKQAIALDDEYLPAYMNLAYLYKRLGQEETAFQFFKKRYQMGQPNDPWTQKAKEELLKIHPEFISWVVTHEAKDLDKQLVMKAHEQFTEKVSRATEHFERAKEFEEMEQYTRAMKEYDQALRLTPQNPKILEARKRLKIKKAKEEFERRSQHALKMLEEGNTYSAKQEVQNMLATIPNE